MTLLFRLFVAGIFGIALFFGYIAIEPSLKERREAGPNLSVGDNGIPRQIEQILGSYQGSTSKGSYVLALTKTGAELRFVDTHKQQFAYRGHYILDGRVLEVQWAESGRGKAWQAMQPIVAKMHLESAEVIRSPDVVFTRVRP